MLPKYTDAISVHNSKIDAQHKKLFEIAQRAYVIGSSFCTKEDITKILTELFDYMRVHFADEEEYMQSIGFPYLEQHKIYHKNIIRDLKTAVTTIKTANEMKEKLQIVTRDWLLKHIIQEDMLIEKFRMTKQLEKSSPTNTQSKDTAGLNAKLQQSPQASQNQAQNTTDTSNELEKNLPIHLRMREQISQDLTTNAPRNKTRR